MFTIYLDQNMWIGLKDAMAGTAGGARFADLPAACQLAVNRGSCRFVLSYSHYEETRRRPQLDDREQVAMVMGALSRYNSMALPQDIVRQEISAALHDVFRLAGERPIYTPFGVGADHAMGFPLIEDGLATIKIPAEYVHQARRYLEHGALVGVDDDYSNVSFDPMLSRENNENYVAHRSDLSARMKSWSRDPDRADRFVAATELIELRDFIDEVGAPLGRNTADLIALGRQAMEEFIGRMPMESIVRYLHRAALLADRAWQLNDHNDVVYLGSAAAYCDAVVGEKHWTSKLNEPRCPTRARYILSSPEEFKTLMAGLLDGSIS